MITATTTGYGDIVPVTDRARLFDAFLITPIRMFFLLIFAGTAYTSCSSEPGTNGSCDISRETLRDHIILAGFGAAAAEALEELLAARHRPEQIVVIDMTRRRSSARATAASPSCSATPAATRC